MNQRFLPQLTKIIDGRVGKATKMLRDIAKEKVSDPFPPASEPFTPPHKRSGGLKRALFAERIGSMDWAFGYRKVGPDPSRKDAHNREDLGLWMELGTGRFAHTPQGSSGSIEPAPSGHVVHGVMLGGDRTSIKPRPVLLPTLLENQDAVSRIIGQPLLANVLTMVPGID